MDADHRAALERELLGYERAGNEDRAAQVRAQLGVETPEAKPKPRKRATSRTETPEG